MRQQEGQEPDEMIFSAMDDPHEVICLPFDTALVKWGGCTSVAPKFSIAESLLPA